MANNDEEICTKYSNYHLYCLFRNAFDCGLVEQEIKEIRNAPSRKKKDDDQDEANDDTKKYGKKGDIAGNIKSSVKVTTSASSGIVAGEEDPELLQQIRLTAINTLLKYHPECSERLAMGETFAPEKKIDVDITSHVHVKEDGPKRRSLLYTETADRPGQAEEMIKLMADINTHVESAETSTEQFLVTGVGELSEKA